jgi:hypothetical protein
MKISNFLFLLLLCFLASCHPEEVTIQVRADDISDAMEGKPVMVPIVYEFDMLGDDKESSLEKASEVIKKYLPEDSKFSISNGDFGKKLRVTTLIPITKFDGKKIGIKGLKSPAILVIEEGDSKFPPYNRKLVLLPVDPIIEQMNGELSNISFGLKFELLAKATNIELEGNGDSALEFLAVAAFVDGKAELLTGGSLKKRQKSVVTFKASIFQGASIWDQIPVHLYLK